MNIEQLENKKEAVSSSSNSGLHKEVFDEMAKTSSASSTRDSRNNERNAGTLEFDNIFKTDLKTSLDNRDANNLDGKSPGNKFVDLKSIEKSNGDKDKNAPADKEFSKDKAEGKDKNHGKDKNEKGKDLDSDNSKEKAADKNAGEKDKVTSFGDLKDKTKVDSASKSDVLEKQDKKDKGEMKDDSKSDGAKSDSKRDIAGEKNEIVSVSRSGGNKVTDIHRIPVERQDERQERQIPRRSAF